MKAFMQLSVFLVVVVINAYGTWTVGRADYALASSVYTADIAFSLVDEITRSGQPIPKPLFQLLDSSAMTLGQSYHSSIDSRKKTHALETIKKIVDFRMKHPEFTPSVK
jgi:hypothetical protein